MTTQHIFNWLIAVFLILAPLTLLIDIPGFIDINKCKSPDIASMNSQSANAKPSNAFGKQQQQKMETEYLMAAYGNSVKEIQERINQEHLLFVLKFTIIGAVLGALFYNRDKPDDQLPVNSTMAATSCWAAVAVSAIVDVRMLVNVDIMQQMGCWIETIETYFISSGIIGWETYFGASRVFSSDASPLLLMDRQLLTWVLYTVTLYVFLIKPAIGSGEHEIRWISKVAIMLCYVIFGFVGLHFYFYETRLLISYGLYFSITFILLVVSIVFLKKPGVPKKSGD